MDDLLRDLRTSWRSLRRRPVFSAAIVATLAIALGANATVFTLVQAIVLRPLPHVDSEGLVAVSMTHDEFDIEAYDFSVPDARDFAAGCTVCLGVEAYDGRSLVLGGDEPERIIGGAVSPGLFSLLGVRPVTGRDFRPGENLDGADQVVLISHRLWRQRLAGDPGVVGTALRIDGTSREVIGVMPEGFRFPSQAEAWIPLVEGTEPQRGERWLDHLVARIDSQVSLAEARARVDALGDRLAADHPESNRGYSFGLLPYRESVTDAGLRHALDLMLGAVFFVLLIACANVAHLMIVRDASRRHETAVRLALGTSRWRLFRQRLTEGLLLSCAGTLLGVLLASWATDWLVQSNPDGFPYWMHFGVEPAVVAYAAGLAVAATLFFTLLPMRRTLATDPATDLRSGGRGSSGPARLRLQRTLVMCESALALVLLFGAFLLVENVQALLRLDPGFDSRNLVVLRTHLAGERYDGWAARGDFAERAATRLGDLPGVTSAAATGAVPLIEDGITFGVITAGMDAVQRAGGGQPATLVGCSTGLFDTLGVAPLSGRVFRATDLAEDAAPVAVVNLRLAQRLWPAESVEASIAQALGRTIRATGREGELTVVGVVPDLYYEEAGEETDQSRFQVHVPYRVAARRSLSLLVRTDLPAASLEPMLRRELRALDADLPITTLRPLEDIRRHTLWGDRLLGQVQGAFAFTALLLAAIGLYGVIAFSVVDRRRELGIRFALGADGAKLVAQVVREGMAQALVGLGVGAVLSVLLSGWIRSNLYSVTDGGWAALGLGAGALLVAVFGACWLPARRAARLDPVRALRCD